MGTNSYESRQQPWGLEAQLETCIESDTKYFVQDCVVTFRDECLAELDRLREDVFWTEKTHFAAASHMLGAHYTLGVIATIASAAAATTIATSAPVAAGIAAVVATIASALITFLKPESRAQQHQGTGRRLGVLRVQIRQSTLLDLAADHPEDFTKWRLLAADFAAQKADIDSSAPGLGSWALRTAHKKIEAGHFVHEASN